MLNFNDFNLVYNLIIVIIALVVAIILIVSSAFYMFIRLKNSINNRDQKLKTLSQSIDAQTLTMEELNQANNQRFNYLNSVFKSMQEGIIAFNKESSIILINPSALKMINIGNEVLVSNTNQNRFYQTIIKQVNQTLDLNNNLSSKFSLTTKEAKHYLIETSIINNKYATNEVIGVIVVINDITEQSKIDDLRTEFIENVSHEFRTPMTLISGIVEMLKTWERLDNKERNRALDIIEIETKRLSKLVNELLTLARLNRKNDGLKLEKININSLVKDVVMVMRELADKQQIKIVEKLAVKPLYVKANYQLLSQAISNVLENAIKYSPPNTKINFEISLEKETVNLKIKDQGLGISKKDQKRIFERFYRVVKDRNTKTGGSGIGLSLVKSILETMQGSISVESQLNRGSTFIIKLPLERN